jgi:hypothetical protein
MQMIRDMERGIIHHSPFEDLIGHDLKFVALSPEQKSWLVNRVQKSINTAKNLGLRYNITSPRLRPTNGLVLLKEKA